MSCKLAFIISANIHRRHMTRAQRAMALAMIAPEPEEESAKGGRGKSAKLFAVFGDEERSAMKRAINKARFVLKYKPVLAQEVLGGGLL